MSKIIEFEESGLKFEFPESFNPYKFDKKTYSGLSAVDFIVETPNNFLLIEVKNLDNPKIPKEKIKEEQEKFIFKTEKHTNECKDCENYKKCPKCERVEFVCEIRSNFKDSLLKELAKGRIFDKPIIYILILEFNKFNSRQRAELYKKINCQLPKFKQNDYSKVHSVKFDLCNYSKYLQTY